MIGLQYILITFDYIIYNLRALRASKRVAKSRRVNLLNKLRMVYRKKLYFDYSVSSNTGHKNNNRTRTYTSTHTSLFRVPFLLNLIFSISLHHKNCIYLHLCYFLRMFWLPYGLVHVLFELFVTDQCWP